MEYHAGCFGDDGDESSTERQAPSPDRHCQTSSPDREAPSSGQQTPSSDRQAPSLDQPELDPALHQRGAGCKSNSMGDGPGSNLENSQDQQDLCCALELLAISDMLRARTNVLLQRSSGSGVSEQKTVAAPRKQPSQRQRSARTGSLRDAPVPAARRPTPRNFSPHQPHQCMPLSLECGTATK